MPYPEMMVAPMREDLTRIGFEELKSPEDVDAALEGAEGTNLLVVNSVCGCAAGAARPGVYLSLQSDPKPARLTTVFAGQDLEGSTSSATRRARPPSPSSRTVGSPGSWNATRSRGGRPTRSPSTCGRRTKSTAPETRRLAARPTECYAAEIERGTP